MLKNSKRRRKFKSILSQFIILTLVATAFICLSPVTVNAATDYYVDGTNGNDSNNGLGTSSAFKTIKQAASVVQAGGIVYIRGGVKQQHLLMIRLCR